MLKRAAFPLIPQCSEAEQAQSRAIWALINPLMPLTRRRLSRARRENPNALSNAI
jgi:hypothetical protein